MEQGMRIQWLVWRWPAVVFAIGILLTAFRVYAELSTDQPGAVLMFPKVVRDSEYDTIIQISNSAGVRISVLCLYINGAPDPTTGAPLWQTVDFKISLTRQQPTVWVAGNGLSAQPVDGRPPDLHPGLIPPVADGFLGALLCLVIDEGEVPAARNALIGAATLVHRGTGSAHKYAAYSVRSVGPNNRDRILALDDREYSACPRLLLLNHFYDQAPDPVSSTPITTNITFVPCSANFEQITPATTTLFFETFNEFEQRLSASLTVTCFADLPLPFIDSRSDPTRSVFHFALQGTLVGQTRIRPVPTRAVELGVGVVAVAEESRDGGQSTTALQPQFIGGSLQADVIVLPSSF